MSEQSQERIYLDHQATTPVDDRVMEAMQPYFTETYGNAASNDHLFGVAERYEDHGKHIVTCKTEHRAVLDPCKELEERGWEVAYLPVDEYGMVDPDDVRDAIRDDTTLVSIMMANNEVGTIAPTAAFASAGGRGSRRPRSTRRRSALVRPGC